MIFYFSKNIHTCTKALHATTESTTNSIDDVDSDSDVDGDNDDNNTQSKINIDDSSMRFVYFSITDRFDEPTTNSSSSSSSS